MRINTYNMISQIYGTNSAKKSNISTSAGQTSFRDEVSFSSFGKDMQIAKNALAGIPDTRAEKVNDIKSRIDNGTYDVSNEDFAEKLMAAFSSK